MLTISYALVPSDHSSEFQKHVRRAIDAGRCEANGLRYVKFARKIVDGHDRFVLVTEWESPAAMFRFQAGETYRDVQGHLQAALALVSEPPVTEMWEAVDVDVDPDTWLPIYDVPCSPQDDATKVVPRAA